MCVFTCEIFELCVKNKDAYQVCGIMCVHMHVHNARCYLVQWMLVAQFWSAVQISKY